MLAGLYVEPLRSGARACPARAVQLLNPHRALLLEFRGDFLCGFHLNQRRRPELRRLPPILVQVLLVACPELLILTLENFVYLSRVVPAQNLLDIHACRLWLTRQTVPEHIEVV